MITGNTVKELNSDNIPGQPNKQPENGHSNPTTGQDTDVTGAHKP